MHMPSKSDLTHCEKVTIRTSKESCTFVTANRTSTTTEEAAENVKDWDMFTTFLYLEESPAVLSLGKLREEHEHSYDRETTTHMNRGWRNYSSQVRKFCAGRIWSLFAHVPETMQMHRESADSSGVPRARSS